MPVMCAAKLPHSGLISGDKTIPRIDLRSAVNPAGSPVRLTTSKSRYAKSYQMVIPRAEGTIGVEHRRS